MFRQKTFAALTFLTVVALTLVACQSQNVSMPVTVVVKETQPPLIQTQIVEQTQVVEVQKEKGAFTTPHPVLGDGRVRQALAYCTDKNELLQAVYPLLGDDERGQLMMNSFIPRSHWAYAGDDNLTLYAFDPAQGATLLDEAGWALADGATFRTNANGDELALKFTTTTAAFRQTWAAVWQQQMEACGIRIVRLHTPASWWFGDTTGLARRDFELGAFAWVGQPDPSGDTLYSCDQIPVPENGWAGQNSMGWCNEMASRNIKQANNTLIKDERIAAYTIVQQEFAKDMVSLPLFNRTNTFVFDNLKEPHLAEL